MNSRIVELQRQRNQLLPAFERAKRELQDVDEEIAEIQRRCNHDWGKVEYCGTRTEGYYIPGDRESGRELGVDSRPGMHVGPQEHKKWRRKCSKCEKVEETDRVKVKQTEEPSF